MKLVRRVWSRDTSSLESIDDNSHKNQDNPNNVHNVLERDPTESINLETANNANNNDGDTDSFSNRSSVPQEEVSETNDDNDNTDVYSNTGSLRRDDTGDISGNITNDNDNSHGHDNDNTSGTEARHLDNDTDINTGYQTRGSVDEEAIELQVMGHAHHPPNLDTDKEDTLSSNDSHDV